MLPLIKWPGGKSTEFQYIKNLIPNFDRYIEPFFGGGAIFFQIQPKKSLINDINTDLVSFYQYVKAQNKDFQNELFLYATSWENIKNYHLTFCSQYLNLYHQYQSDQLTTELLKTHLNNTLSASLDTFERLFSKEFYLNRDNLLKQIFSNLLSKIKRLKTLEAIHGRLPVGDIENNLETAIRSGFYMHFRDLMNSKVLDGPKKVANYYFVREFCYGSMFRFNSKGEFNIPYGGIAYNTKNIVSKIDRIFSDEAKEVFKNTQIKNQDFEQVLNEADLTSSDFVFLDPPYDTDFSDYEKNIFAKSDQERLAKHLYSTKAKFLLIIKNTPFIYQLYNNQKNIKIDSFEKSYLYNVRGRNNREVEHLVIYNY